MKVLKTLLLGVLLATASCTPEDTCGYVTGWDIDDYGNYVLYVDGTSYTVNASTWFEYNTGDYICLEF